MAGTLFIVPTPVGNLEDMTPRAVRVLSEADVVLAEDTRTSAPLLKHFGINTRLMSHHKFNEHATCQEVVDRILGGENVALISDAGTPGISDPGFLLSRACKNAGVNVVTLPGPTALIPAIVNSGLPCDRFVFQGFLPVKKGRKTRLEEIASSEITNVIYESPVRLVKTLKELIEFCGETRNVSVSREISKIYEETVSSTLGELIAYYEQHPPKGEIVIVVAGRPAPEKKEHKNKYRQ